MKKEFLELEKKISFKLGKKMSINCNICISSKRQFQLDIKIFLINE